MVLDSPFLLTRKGSPEFVGMCYQLFLGRDLDSLSVAEERGAWPEDEIIRSICESDEFAMIVQNLLSGQPMESHKFTGEVSDEQRSWVLDRLLLTDETRAAVQREKERRGLLGLLLGDEQLMEAAGLSVLTGIVPSVTNSERGNESDASDAVVLDRTDRTPLWTSEAGRLDLWR